MAQHADRCIERLDADRLDITQLLAVQHWEWLDKTETGQKIKRFIEIDMRLSRGEVVNKAFHQRVVDVFQERGIVDLAPERRVEAYFKEELFKLYHAAKWPEPHTPYLLQMRPGLYILLSSYQAGFHLIKRMATDGRYRSKEGKDIALSLLYEGQMEGVPCRIILDCEAYVSHFDGRLSHEELLASVQRVPQAFVRRLAQLGAVDERAVVRVFEKNKCRGEKISFHYTFNILIDPTVDGKRVLAQALIEPYTEEWAAWKKTKSMVHALDKATGQCDPLLHVDICTVKGKHQFSVVFSRKEGEEPCAIERRLDISNRGETVRVFPSAWARDPHLPTHPRALEMLYYAGFTHWIRDSITLPKQFRIVHLPVNSHDDDDSRRETRTHAHPVTVAGKNKGGCWFSCSQCQWRATRRREQLPAAVDEVSGGQVWVREGEGLRGCYGLSPDLPCVSEQVCLWGGARRRQARDRGSVLSRANPLRHTPVSLEEWTLYCKEGGGDVCCMSQLCVQADVHEKKWEVHGHDGAWGGGGETALGGVHGGELPEGDGGGSAGGQPREQEKQTGQQEEHMTGLKRRD